MTLLIAILLALSPDVQPVKHRITGLFNRQREADLRKVAERMTEVTVVSIDFDRAEVVFSYDPAKLFPKTREKDLPERFDNLLRTLSSSTFGARPLSTTPAEQLTRVEIPVLGLDCQGCCLSAYESVFKIDGVEQATASFKDGLVTALIDPAKTNRAALEEALKKRGVALKAP